MLRLYRFFAVSLLFSLAFSFVVAVDPIAQSEEEALFVRRIIELWKGGEHTITKAQVDAFLKKYPTSAFNESFQVLLGDIYFKGGEYERALEAYEEVQTSSLLDKILINKSHSLYCLQRHRDLMRLLAPYFEKKSENLFEGAAGGFLVFYYAESLFRSAVDSPDLDRSRCLQAKLYYESLLGGDEFSQRAKLALANVHKVLENYREAADYYLSVFENSPENGEVMLFHAAMMQMRFDRSLAEKTFAKVLKTGGERASDAAYNWISLKFDRKDFQLIVSEKEELFPLFKGEKESYFRFIMGSCYFALSQYKEAVEELRLFLSMGRASTEDKKESLLMIMASAYRLRKTELLEETIRFLSEIFPSDDNVMAKALFFRVLMDKNKGDEGEVELGLKRIIEEFPHFEHIDVVEFERCVSLYRRERWKESYFAFERFIENFPESSYVLQARYYLLNISTYFVSNSQEGGLSRDLRLQFIQDLQKAPDFDGLFDRDQVQEYRLNLASVLFDIREYEKSLEMLQNYLKFSLEGDDLQRAHLIMALCYHKGDLDLGGFIFHAERFLTLYPKTPNRTLLCFHLFSAYLQRAKSIGFGKESDLFRRKAAEHLYSVFSEGETVGLENLLWLANYYYEFPKKHMEEDWRHCLESSEYLMEADRSKRIFEFVLGIENGSLAFDEEDIFLESAAFKLADLLGWMEKPDKKTALLERLHERQAEHPEWNWNLRGQTLLALGQSYETKGEYKKALEKYEELLPIQRKVDSYAKNKSLLQALRISFSFLSEKKPEKGDPEVARVLQGLKDLQTRKKILDEPVHLEAAMDYAEILSSLAGEDKKEEELLFYLTCLKEDFTLQEDIWSKDYGAARKIYPEKDIVYHAYMILVDARIAQLQAKIAREKGILHEARSKEKAACSLFATLLKGKFAVSKYLVEKASAALSGMDAKILSQDEKVYEASDESL